MEDETHRRDRELLLADRRAVAERIRRETENAVSAATVERRQFLEWFESRLQRIARDEARQEQHLADLRTATQEPGQSAPTATDQPPYDAVAAPPPD